MKNQIFISEDNQRIELTGARKQAFLAQREIDLADAAVKKAEAQAEAEVKAAAKAAAQAKLAALGLTVEDLTALGL